MISLFQVFFQQCFLYRKMSKRLHYLQFIYGVQCSPSQVVGAVGYAKQRLEPPAGTHPQIKDLIRRCCTEQASERPSFGQVISELQELDAGMLESQAEEAEEPQP